MQILGRLLKRSGKPLLGLIAFLVLIFLINEATSLGEMERNSRSTSLFKHFFLVVWCDYRGSEVRYSLREGEGSRRIARVCPNCYRHKWYWPWGKEISYRNMWISSVVFKGNYRLVLQLLGNSTNSCSSKCLRVKSETKKWYFGEMRWYFLARVTVWSVLINGKVNLIIYRFDVRI